MDHLGQQYKAGDPLPSTLHLLHGEPRVNLFHTGPAPEFTEVKGILSIGLDGLWTKAQTRPPPP